MIRLSVRALKAKSMHGVILEVRVNGKFWDGIVHNADLERSTREGRHRGVRVKMTRRPKYDSKGTVVRLFPDPDIDREETFS